MSCVKKGKKHVMTHVDYPYCHCLNCGYVCGEYPILSYNDILNMTPEEKEHRNKNTLGIGYRYRTHGRDVNKNNDKDLCTTSNTDSNMEYMT